MPESVGDSGAHLQALLFCEAVNEDSGPLKRPILVAVITHAFLPVGTTELPNLVAYVLLWNLSGRCELRLEWYAPDGEGLEFIPATVEQGDPRRAQEIIVDIPGLPIRGSGRYEMRAVLDGRFVGRAPMVVELRPGMAIRPRSSN